MSKNTHSRFRLGWLRASGLALGLLALTTLGAGCGSEDSSLTGPGNSESETPAGTVETSVEMDEVFELSSDMQRDTDIENVAESLAVRGGLFVQLDLTQEQMEALRAARLEFREAVAALLEEFGDSQSTLEFQEELAQLRADLEAAIMEILTPEQYALLQELRLEQFVMHVEHLIRRIEAHRDRVIEFLDRVVDLTDEQEVAIAAIFDARVDTAQGVLDDLEAGQVTLQEAREALRGFLHGIHDEIAEVLTPEQLAILAEMNGPRGNRPDGRM